MRRLSSWHPPAEHACRGFESLLRHHWKPRYGAVFCFSERSGRLDELMPHPVYAWMSWVQILSSSTAAGYASLRALLAETLDFARGKWNGRK
jgi:hypothetical protein